MQERERDGSAGDAPGTFHAPAHGKRVQNHYHRRKPQTCRRSEPQVAVAASEAFKLMEVAQTEAVDHRKGMQAKNAPLHSLAKASADIPPWGCCAVESTRSLPSSLHWIPYSPTTVVKGLSSLPPVCTRPLRRMSPGWPPDCPNTATVPLTGASICAYILPMAPACESMAFTFSTSFDDAPTAKAAFPVPGMDFTASVSILERGKLHLAGLNLLVSTEASMAREPFLKSAMNSR